MEFDPSNPVVRLCIHGMDMEAKQAPEEAYGLFSQAWDIASNDLEKYLAAYYCARHQAHLSGKLEWLETSLHFALKMDSAGVQSALPALYSGIAKCHEELGNPEQAKKYAEIAREITFHPSDKGPFYHGTKADLKTGDFLTAGNRSNYQQEVIMNHIYFTALVNGAGLAAALARGEGRERVYVVEPTGVFENDPNVTDKKFPGNPTRSYRTALPLKIVGEVHDWQRLTPEALQKWKQRLDNSKGEIIN